MFLSNGPYDQYTSKNKMEPWNILLPRKLTWNLKITPLNMKIIF